MNVTQYDQQLASGACPVDPRKRREFLKLIAAGAFGLPLAACSTMGNSGGQAVDLGSGDVGIMNYAYLLEGLEAEFYTRVNAQPYSGMSREESRVLRDIRDHEIVHREFFRRALGANAIPPVQYDFSRVNFQDRASVLATAQTFEDLGVAAYNGAGSSVKDPHVLVTAGKIVSVEARHASVLRDLISPSSGAFAPGAFDAAEGSSSVLRKARPFIVTSINASHLPC